MLGMLRVFVTRSTEHFFLFRFAYRAKEQLQRRRRLHLLRAQSTRRYLLRGCTPLCKKYVFVNLAVQRATASLFIPCSISKIVITVKNAYRSLLRDVLIQSLIDDGE